MARWTWYNIMWPARNRWLSPGTPISSTNKTDRNDISEILLKVVLITKNQTNPIIKIILFLFEYLLDS